MQKSIYTAEQQAFVRLLKEVRLEAGFTQESLAEKLKTVQSRIADYEHGTRRMDLMELQQYCEALDLPLDAFVARYIAQTRP